MTAPHFVPGLSFPPERIEQRRKTLGASELPILAGVNPYKSPLTLWMEKRGTIQSFEGNAFTEWGTRLEAVIADAYAEKQGVVLDTSDTLIHPTETWLSATPDRLVRGEARGLEIKCRGEYRADEWGEPGTDEVPHDVAVQCYGNMMVTGLMRWDVATLIGGNKFRMYELRYDAEIADYLLGIGRTFWFDYVVAGVQPPVDPSAATGRLLAKRFPVDLTPMREATLDEAVLIESLKEAREEKKAAEEREQHLKNLLMEAIGDSAGLTSPAGKVTWKRPSGTVTQWKEVALVAGATPEQIAQFSKPHSRRFLPTFPKEK